MSIPQYEHDHVWSRASGLGNAGAMHLGFIHPAWCVQVLVGGGVYLNSES